MTTSPESLVLARSNRSDPKRAAGTGTAGGTLASTLEGEEEEEAAQNVRARPPDRRWRPSKNLATRRIIFNGEP